MEKQSLFPVTVIGSTQKHDVGNIQAFLTLKVMGHYRSSLRIDENRVSLTLWQPLGNTLRTMARRIIGSQCVSGGDKQEKTHISSVWVRI
jgi:hypothetical protein